MIFFRANRFKEKGGKTHSPERSPKKSARGLTTFISSSCIIISTALRIKSGVIVLSASTGRINSPSANAIAWLRAAQAPAFG